MMISTIRAVKVGMFFLFGFLAFGAAQAAPDESGEFYHQSMMGWGGWFYGPVMMVVFFGLLVGAVVLILRLLGLGPAGPASGGGDKALDILRERFARGEISREEFEQSSKVLK